MNYVEYDESNLQSFEITQKAISNGSLVGTCELGNAEIELINDSNEYSEFKDKWIRTPFGSLYIYDVEPKQEKVSIKLHCYDIKSKLDVEYKQSDYDRIFPCTIATWRNRIARDLGLDFNDGNTFPNSTFNLPTHPYVEPGSSYRDVMKMIAEASASWVECDSNDKLQFKWVSSNELNIPDWLELTTEKVAKSPVNVVVLGRGDVEDIEVYPKPQPSNPVEFRIDNNYVLDPQDSEATTDRRKDVIQPIYNRVRGFTYIPFEMRTQSVENTFDFKLGTKVKYIDIWGNEVSSIIMTRTLKWLGNDLTNQNNYELSISAEDNRETSSDYQKSNPSDKLTRIGISVDKQNGKIESVVEAVGDRTGKTSTITQDLDRIESQISEIADITVSSESDYATLEFTDTINQSEPIFIQIRPTLKNISYLYPYTVDVTEDTLKEMLEYCTRQFYETYYHPQTGSNYETRKAFLQRFEIVGIKVSLENLARLTADELYQNYISILNQYCDKELTRGIIYPHEEYNVSDYNLNIEYKFNNNYSEMKYPSSDLYPTIRTLRFRNNTTNEIFDYDLPDDLLIFNEQYYDEFVLDYENQVCKIEKRCEYNSKGQVVLLETSKTQTYDFPELLLTEGKYTVSLLGYNNGYLFVRLMASNIYTSQFATKVELNSAIKQTSSVIELSVNKKIEGVDKTIDGIYTSLSSKLDLTDQSIVAEVKRATVQEKTLGDDLNTISGKIELKIDKDDNDQVVSMLNASADQINIKGNRFVLDSTNFKVSKDGTIKATNGEFTGKITSTNGLIGGWNISNDKLAKNDFYINSQGYTNVYVIADIYICQLIVLGTLSAMPGTKLFNHYDVNGDGIIDIKDMLAIQKMIMEDR